MAGYVGKRHWKCRTMYLYETDNVKLLWLFLKNCDHLCRFWHHRDWGSWDPWPIWGEPAVLCGQGLWAPGSGGPDWKEPVDGCRRTPSVGFQLVHQLRYYYYNCIIHTLIRSTAGQHLPVSFNTATPSRPCLIINKITFVLHFLTDVQARGWVLKTWVLLYICITRSWMVCRCVPVKNRAGPVSDMSCAQRYFFYMSGLRWMILCNVWLTVWCAGTAACGREMEGHGWNHQRPAILCSQCTL